MEQKAVNNLFDTLIMNKSMRYEQGVENRDAAVGSGDREADGNLVKGTKIIKASPQVAKKGAKKFLENFSSLRRIVSPNAKGLIQLDLGHRELHELPAEVFNFVRVEVLKLNNNQLQQISNAIGQLRKLVVLNVQHNDLIMLPDTLVNCQLLIELDCSYNKLTSLPVNINGLTRLRSLRLGHNEFEILPNPVGLMESLRSLELQGNNLWHLPFTSHSLHNLKYLNLADNLFDHVPLCLCDLKALEKLNLKGNQLNTLPFQMEKLNYLSELNLADNNFENISSALFGMRSLQYLNLARNRLRQLPQKMAKISRLRTLHLQGNQLMAMPNDFENLQYLNVASNSFRNLSVAKMKSMKSLNANNNRLENMPLGVYHLQKLEVLRLNGNQLRDLSQDVAMLRKLKVLDLGNNEISSIPTVIDELDNLEFFNIKGNKITNRLALFQKRELREDGLLVQMDSPKKSKQNKQKKRGKDEGFSPVGHESRITPYGTLPVSSSRNMMTMTRDEEPPSQKTKRTQTQSKSAPVSPVAASFHTRKIRTHNKKVQVSLSPPSSVSSEETPHRLHHSSSTISLPPSIDSAAATIHMSSESEDERPPFVSDVEQSDVDILRLEQEQEAKLSQQMLKSVLSHKANYRRGFAGGSMTSGSNGGHGHGHSHGHENREIAARHGNTRSSPHGNPHAHVQANPHYANPTTDEENDQDETATNSSLMRTRTDQYLVTGAGGLFRSTIDRNIKIYFPVNSTAVPLDIAMQIERISETALRQAKQEVPEIENIVSIGAIVRIRQTPHTEFSRQVTLTIPAPPRHARKEGKLHILTYRENNTCVPCQAGFMVRDGYIYIQSWHFSGRGAVITHSKCKYKACKSVEALLKHLYV